MIRRLPLVLILCAALTGAAAQAPVQEDTLLRAMSDELNRARTLRLVASLETPYYVEYGVHDAQTFRMTASLGAVSEAQRGRARLPRIRVRVGDYKFDNGNYIYSDFNFGSRYNLSLLPVDDNYMALRHHFWLATDGAYKSALEIIARKRAALRNVTVADQTPDFSSAEPVKLIEAIPQRAVDEEGWRSRLRALSALFAAYPRIISSRVDLGIGQGAFYLVNSEGTRVRVPESAMHFQARASALATDGMTLRDSWSFHALDAGATPPVEDLRRQVQSLAENLDALVQAPVGEPYTGPVMFEPEAAAQLLAEVLGRSFALRRRPISEPGRPLPFVDSELEGRLDSRILPEWMDVVDDPTLAEWRGRPLLGRYKVDLEGVVPKPLVLVEKGVLKDYIQTRQPLRGRVGSNGRARLRGGFGANAAAISNLFVRTGEPRTLAELKKRLLDLCSQRNKPYGMLVRKMDFPSSASRAEFQRLAAAMSQDGASAARLVSLPVLVYRVYPDGREELVRGLRFRDLTVRSMRDIVAAGGDPVVFDFLENGAPFALMGAASFVAESSVIAPGILFEELQLTRSERELPKLPMVPPPPLALAH